MDYEEMDKTYAKKKKDIVQEWIDEGIKIGRRQAVDEIEKGILKSENLHIGICRDCKTQMEKNAICIKRCLVGKLLQIVQKAGGGE